MTADSTVTQTVTNAGLIQFGDFMTLTTQNYAGLGGTLGLNTYLGSDGSPSDRLVISGGLGDRQHHRARDQCRWSGCGNDRRRHSGGERDQWGDDIGKRLCAARRRTPRRRIRL